MKIRIVLLLMLLIGCSTTIISPDTQYTVEFALYTDAPSNMVSVCRPDGSYITETVGSGAWGYINRYRSNDILYFDTWSRNVRRPIHVILLMKVDGVVVERIDTIGHASVYVTLEHGLL